MEKDYLTGALDRHGLYEWYENLHKGTILQFMFLDLDNFKMVNDTYGHSTGDELLIAVAKILETCMEQATCVRLSGDEFVVVIKGRTRRQKVIDTAETINRRIQQKEGFDEIDTDVSASIGILLNQNSNDSLNEILFKIDTAMYQAKSNGKSCYVVFNDIADEVYDGVMMEQRQSDALNNKEFEIYYKPVFNPQTSRLILSEVKMVWNMEDGSRRTQEEFLPVFEKNGFIRELDLWAFVTVCKQIAQFPDRKLIKSKTGIRISRLLLVEKNLPRRFETIMELYGVGKNEICFEVEEKVFSRGGENVFAGLKKLQESGFSISVINVGVEFTSLKYWDKLCLDYIMLDASYLKGALSTSRGRLILKTLFLIGNDLNIRVIADGITRKEDVIFLGGCGCIAVSGGYYSDPMPVPEYKEYVKGKLAYGRQKAEFRFIDGYSSSNGRYTCDVTGGVRLDEGISPNWGSVYFPGGEAMGNVLKLPTAVLPETSYTVGMWLKPVNLNSWSSVLYARYVGGFMSYVPYAIGGNSVFRISEDIDLNGWHDILSRQLHTDKWYFVCMTYNEGVSRCYINGRKCGFKADVPLLTRCRQVLVGGDPFQESYNGYISALTFFDSAMSEDEIQGWYRQFLEEDGFRGEEETFWDVMDYGILP